jgi:hypothetical protein
MTRGPETAFNTYTEKPPGCKYRIHLKTTGKYREASKKEPARQRKTPKATPRTLDIAPLRLVLVLLSHGRKPILCDQSYLVQILKNPSQILPYALHSLTQPTNTTPYIAPSNCLQKGR